jgi:hypothetical protein
MDGLDTSRLVLILSKEPRQAAWRFGTGYFLTETSILTASHVIPEFATEVVARVEATGGRHKAQIVDGKVSVIWRDPLLDVVLFDVAPGIAKPEVVQWMEAMPRNDAQWRSTGYPRAATESDGTFERFTTAGLAGKLYSQGGGGQSGSELDLGVEDGAVPQSWRGISGAPVFVDNQLAGIIIQVPDDFKGGRLRGIRAPTLLANASFREAIEPRWLRWPQDQSWVLVIKSEQPPVDLPPKVAGHQEVQRSISHRRGSVQPATRRCGN